MSAWRRAATGRCTAARPERPAGDIRTTRNRVASLLTGSGPLRIGGNGPRGEFFAGLVDEVRVYDRVLSATQIGEDMNSPVLP